MSEDRIYSVLLEIKGQLGRLEEAQYRSDKKIDKIDTRLTVLEEKPVKRIEGGVTTAISTFVAAVVAAVTSVVIKK